MEVISIILTVVVDIRSYTGDKIVWNLHTDTYTLTHTLTHTWGEIGIRQVNCNDVTIWLYYNLTKCHYLRKVGII